MVYPYFEKDLSEYGTHIITGEWDIKYTSHAAGHTTGNSRFDFYTSLGLDEHAFFNSIKNWMQNKKYEETEYYQIEKMKSGEKQSNQRRNKLSNIKNNILSEGYKKQTKMWEDGESGLTPHQKVMHRPEHFEVEIAIGRDGEYYFNDGKHRFSIAKYGPVDKIPVRVIARHSEWQTVREKIDKADDVSKLPVNVRRHLNHPDIEDVL